MLRIDSSNARANVNGVGKLGFHDNTDLLGQDATYLTPTWLNTIQEELCSIIEKNGYTLNQNSRQQLYEIIATNTDLLALADAIEQRLTVFSTKNALEQAVGSVMSDVLQHKNASNPHPQYLLAATFGVNILMNASLTTDTIDSKRVFGWNGESGDTNFGVASVSWWRSHTETVTFKPYRAYGKFLLAMNFQPQGDGTVHINTFNKNGELIKSETIFEVHNTAVQPVLKHIFELQQDAYAEITYSMSVWNYDKGHASGSIYVEDRVKRFVPVSYTSIVDSTNIIENTSIIEQEDYSVFPNYEWFYYNVNNSEYVQLSSVSSLSSTVNHIPQFHRHTVANLNTELWVVVEVGKQTLSNDYTALEQVVLRAGSDEDGVAITQIPLNMRSIETPNNETLVFKIAYYDSQQSTTLGSIPTNSIGGEHLIYYRA